MFYIVNSLRKFFRINFDFKKNNKNNNKKVERGDLLFLEDKKQIIKLTQEQEKHLKEIKKIERKITVIQNSSKTLVPVFSKWHNRLQKKSKIYHKWHLSPYAKTTHWIIFLIVLLSSTAFFFSPFFTSFLPVRAGDTYVWIGGALGQESTWNEITNWSPEGVPASGDSVVFNASSTMPCVINGIDTWGTGATGETITITADMSLLVTADTHFTVTDFTQAGGIFAGNSNTIIITNDINLSGGLFVAPSNLIIGNDFNLSGTIDFDAGSSDIAVDGDWSVTGDAYFNADAGTVIFDNNIKTTNISGDTIFNNLECTTLGKQIVFEAESTQTIGGELTLTGATGDDRIVLRSSIEDTQWNIIASATSSISYIDIQDSYNNSVSTLTAQTSVDSGNNDRWLFEISVSGSCVGGSGSYTINVLLNGSVIDPDFISFSFSVEGIVYFTITIEDADAGDVLVLAATDSDSHLGGVVTKIDPSNNISGLQIIVPYLIARYEDDGPITNADFSKGMGAENLGIYSVDGSNNLTMDLLDYDPYFLILADKTYKPEGNVNIYGLEIQSGADFQAESNTINITGPGGFHNQGTFTPGSSTVNIDVGFTGEAASLDFDLDNASSSFYNLNIANAGDESQTLNLATSSLDVDGDFAVNSNDGYLVTFNVNALDQNYAGNFTLSASTTYTKGGTLTFDGNGATSTYTDNTVSGQNIGTVVIGGESPNELILATDMLVDYMTINSDNTLDLGTGNTLDLVFNGAHTPPPALSVLNVSGTLDPGESTVKYSAVNSEDNVNVTTTTYHHLQLSGAETYDLAGNLTEANSLTGNLTIDLGATLDATANDYGLTLAGNWDNNGTFTKQEGTVTFNAAAGTQTIDNGSDSFHHLIFSNAGTRQLSTNDLDVDGNFSLSGGTLDCNSLNQNYAGNLTIADGATYTKGGTLTFDGTTQNYTDSNTTKQNIGITVINDTTVSLLTSMTVDTLNIDATSEMDLGNDGYTLKLSNNGATDTVLTKAGTLTPGTSTVEYAALNSGGNVNITVATYDSLSFTGAETYDLANSLTGGNSLTGNLTIDTDATLDVTASNYDIALAGNWSNSGIFTERSGTIDFSKAIGTQTLNSGGVGANKSFNNLTHSGDGTLQLITNDLDIDGNLINSAGTLNVNGQNIYINGNWSNSATFTASTGTVIFDSTTDAKTQTLDSGGVGVGNLFNNLTIDISGAGSKVQLSNNNIDINGNFNLTTGTFDCNSLNQNYAGNLTIADGTTYTKGGTLTFDGTGNLTDNNAVPQNLGVIVISDDSTRTLQSSSTIDTLDINIGSTLALGSSGYILNLANNGATADIFTASGTLSPGTDSIVKYSAVNSGGNINVAATTYNSIQFSGAETYDLAGNLTEANSLTGNLTIDSGATLDATANDYGITLAGNWDNQGSFSPEEGIVTFNGISNTQTINNPITFYDLNINNNGGEVRLESNIIANDFELNNGDFNTNSFNQTFKGNVILGSDANYIKGGIFKFWAFTGESDVNFTDQKDVAQNLGDVVIGHNTDFPGITKKLTLLSNITVDTLSIEGSEMDLGNDGYTLKLANNGASSTVLTKVGGTLTPGTSTVEYAALNSGGNVNVATVYDSVSFTGAETYDLADDIIVNSDLYIGSGATLNTDGKSITIAGNWTNEGTFTHGDGEVTFNNEAKTSIISGDTTFNDFTCQTSNKTLSFISDSTQTILGIWTIEGTDSNHITLSRSGGSGTDYWYVNPDDWSVDYVTVSNSTNQAASYIDPINYTDDGNNVNWFPSSGLRWCEKENQYIPEDEWTSDRCVAGGGSAWEWCAAENKHILLSEWSAERCNVKWCEIEEDYVLEIEWTEERCEPEEDINELKWCIYEQKYIPEDEWTEERCNTKWCEFEKKNILEIEWTSIKCNVKWCEKEKKNILEIEWTEERCRPDEEPDGYKWCEEEGVLIPEDEWTNERCLNARLRWCAEEGQYIPEDEWTQRRCERDGNPWCEVERRYLPEDEWTEERCVPPGTRFCYNEQEYIPEDEWTKERCEPESSSNFFNLPVLGGIAKVTTITGLGFGALPLISRFLFYPLRFKDWLLLLSRILVLFGLKKKVKSWGTVYDSVTKQPLDPAYVSLENMEGKEVADSITDLDGRYGFLVEPGIYKMVASKTNYKFPSQKLYGKNKDEVYNNLYFGGNVEVKEKGDVIMNDIPMDMEKFDWNEFAKKRQKLMMFYSDFDIILRKVSIILFGFGFITSIVSLFYSPTKLNIIILALYIVMLLLILFGSKARTYGSVIDKAKGQPLSFAIIRVFNAEIKKELFKRVADKFGRYYILVPKGQFYLEIDKKEEDGSYTHIFTSDIIATDAGVIKNKFEV